MDNGTKVVGVKMAIVQEEKNNQEFWYAYLINTNTYPLKDVLISSRGYGQINGKEKETSILRQYFEEIKDQSFVEVEPLDPKIFLLNNEFWVSYYVEGIIHDKKFIFLPESIREENMMHINELGLKGVLHS